MSLFGMQVACNCGDAEPSPMENVSSWDGDGEGSFTVGRRYVWECQICGHKVCINMMEVDEE